MTKNTRAKFFSSLFMLIFICGLYISCLSTSKESELIYKDLDLIPQEYKWLELTESKSVLYTEYENGEKKIKYHLIKVNLKDSNLKPVAYPNAKDGKTLGKNETVKLKSVCEFSKENDLIFAVNATPFSFSTHSTGTFSGIWKSNGTDFSLPWERYCQLEFYTEKENFLEAQISPLQKQTEAQFILGGFFIILYPEEDYSASYKNIKDARLAAGLSLDGSILYILCAEGGFNSLCPGLSYSDCAVILKNLGCTKAMEFDGGRSLKLCIKNKKIIPAFHADLRPRVISMFGFREE